MRAVPVIAIIDVGKTYKKLFLFDQHYRIVYERTARIPETRDEDGDPCENLESLRLFVFESLQEVASRKEFEVRVVNFSAYGASLVYIDKEGKPVAPLYNYLKPYPEGLKKQFYDTYGGEEAFSLQTASPVLGSLNSGMQLYRLRYEQPEVFNKVRYALHLPQYLSFLLSDTAYSDITSIGCHTNLWDFSKGEYHAWVEQEGIKEKLAPVAACDRVVPATHSPAGSRVGIGLHDSSAALIPYLVSFAEPFVLISTGTWCISLNPFNYLPLTAEELKQDCLCYLGYKGTPVKASRLFAGQEHEEQVGRITEHFHQNPARYRSMSFRPELVAVLNKSRTPVVIQKKPGTALHRSAFKERALSQFASDEEAYHQLMYDIVVQQYHSTQLVLGGTTVKRIFVDGGFSKNTVYMNLLAAAFPQMEVFAASMGEATALGTALAIHRAWNKRRMASDLIELKYYPAACDAFV
jgi:sugar (pentulose or hexulose) kinase